MSNSSWEKRTMKRYLFAAVVSAAFSTVYEAFSHGVISWYMVLMFLWPLLGGALPFWLLSRYRRRRVRWLTPCLYHSGITTLTLGSCVAGIFEIYGTTSEYVTAYWVVGAVLTLAGAIGLLASCVKRVGRRTVGGNT